MEIVVVILVSFFAGLVGSISSGGGLLTIPALLLLGYSPLQVIGTTRAGSFFGGVASLYKYQINNKIKWKYVKLLFLPSAAAGLVGPKLLTKVDQDQAVLIIGLVLLVISIWMLVKKNYGTSIVKKRSQNSLIGFLLIFPVMLFAVMFGAGGGVLVINIMIFFFGLKMLEATATGIAVWVVGTGVATIVYFANGHYIAHLTLLIIIFSALGGYIGANYVLKKSSKWIVKALGLVVLIASVKLLIS